MRNLILFSIVAGLLLTIPHKEARAESEKVALTWLSAAITDTAAEAGCFRFDHRALAGGRPQGAAQAAPYGQAGV